MDFILFVTLVLFGLLSFINISSFEALNDEINALLVAQYKELGLKKYQARSMNIGFKSPTTWAPDEISAGKVFADMGLDLCFYVIEEV
jgi:uncharacterized protein YpbB